ncbi:hypothetical protein BKA56DRAFT_574515 [Ilyonectria sp. MPI-CAGE-AT-0026]|nr:hypothetical protein BKA56DRAFT_574515 [Ilyonectria sp. MPI-CAGE-AT-0026]
MYCKRFPNPILTLTKSGLTYVDLGKVESKSSSLGGDVCLTDESHWKLSYHARIHGGSASSR